MDERDLTLRQETYRLFVKLGRAPTIDEVGQATDLARRDVSAGWQRLHDAHALVLDRETGQIRMAAPFSAVATAFRVYAAGRSWYGNCAWDAFGVCAALRVDGAIETACPDCNEAIRINVREERPWPSDSVFHCLVPAARWWDDPVFT